MAGGSTPPVGNGDGEPPPPPPPPPISGYELYPGSNNIYLDRQTTIGKLRDSFSPIDWYWGGINQGKAYLGLVELWDNVTKFWIISPGDATVVKAGDKINALMPFPLLLLDGTPIYDTTILLGYLDSAKY
jgi:hypothetical protein